MTTSATCGNRSRLANFSRSSTTCTSKPASCAIVQTRPDVTGANHVERRVRFDRFDVDAHLSAAHQSGFLREVVVQLVVHELRLAGRSLRALSRTHRSRSIHRRWCRPGAIREHQHLCADLLGRRARGRHDGDERRGFSALQSLGDGSENFLASRGLMRQDHGTSPWFPEAPVVRLLPDCRG